LSSTKGRRRQYLLGTRVRYCRCQAKGCSQDCTANGTNQNLKDRENEHEKDEKGRAIYCEEHDDKSVFFLDHIEAGTWEIRFGMRATTPGDFRALPVQASAMYVPEVRANSDARRVRIEARSPSLQRLFIEPGAGGRRPREFNGLHSAAFFV